MTPAGFPHSDIYGSMLGRQLPVAFRSLPRPSSASGAKASTVGSLYLGESDARARYGVLKGPWDAAKAAPWERNRNSLKKDAEPVSGTRTRQASKNQPGGNYISQQVISDRLES